VEEVGINWMLVNFAGLEEDLEEDIGAIGKENQKKTKKTTEMD